MEWLIGGWRSLGEVAAKTVLMYATAVLVLRMSERRTLAQWTIIDFATAVAMGAVIGRTTIVHGQSYVVGAVALVVFAAVHRVASVIRRNGTAGKLFDHRIRILVRDGVVREDQLRKCGLTRNDLDAQLRQRGVFTVDHLAYVLYETKGDITVVPSSSDTTPLVTSAVDGAVDTTAKGDPGDRAVEEPQQRDSSESRQE